MPDTNQIISWSQIVPIIAAQSIEFAYAVWQKWSSGNPPTDADFQELIAMAKQTATDRTKERLALAGIAPDSDEGKILLGLVSAPAS